VETIFYCITISINDFNIKACFQFYCHAPKPEAISPLNSIREEDTEDYVFFDANPFMPSLVENDAVGESQPRGPEGEEESTKILSLSETIMRFLLMLSLFDFIKRHLSELSQKKLLKFQKYEDEHR
jgi:hypothetical protein